MSATLLAVECRCALPRAPETPTLAGSFSPVRGVYQDPVTIVVAREPLLGVGGFSCGHLDGPRKPWCRSLGCGQPSECQAEDRSALTSARSRAVIADVISVLASCRRTSAVRPAAPSSYELKHAAERLIREPVTNGQLIVAALVAGFKIQRYDNGPNCGIGIYALDFKRLRTTSPAATGREE